MKSVIISNNEWPSSKVELHSGHLKATLAQITDVYVIESNILIQHVSKPLNIPCKIQYKPQYKPYNK